MKRILAVLLCLAMLASLAACATGEKETATAPAETEAKTEETKKTEEKKTKEAKTGEETPPAETGEGIAPTLVITTPATVENPLTWDRINAIPVADGTTMTIDQMRQICVDFFCLQVTFTWTPKEDTKYAVGSQKKEHYRPGGVYGGIPYVHLGAGATFEQFSFGLRSLDIPGYDIASGIKASEFCSQLGAYLAGRAYYKYILH